MPSTPVNDLEQSITLFESMLECHLRVRERLLERRRGATDHVMVEIDERLVVNARTTESIRRAVECLREQLKLQEAVSQGSTVLAEIAENG